MERTQNTAYCAVDNKYNGMLQNKEIVRKLKIGEKVQARVLSVREDGKLNLSLREKSIFTDGC